jgi:hypothetical protein
MGDTVARVASVTDRVVALSMVNDVPAGIAAVVAALSVTRHAPEIDFTNDRAGSPAAELEISRFTKPVADVQSVAVNVVDAAGIAAVFVIVRAEPLWYTALEKSWIVNVDDTKSPLPPVEWLKMQAIRR